MGELLKKSSAFTRIEFWALTTIFVFLVFFFITEGLTGDQAPFAGATYYPFFKEVHMPFHFYKHYFFPQFARHIGLYAALISLNFIIIPNLLSRASLLQNIIMFIVVLGALALLYGVTGTWLHAYRYASGTTGEVNAWIFRNGFENAWTHVIQVLIF